jgi:hypothetical protein
MILRLIAWVLISGVMVLSAPAFAGENQQGQNQQGQNQQEEQAGGAGVWELIPLPDSKVPAAWVFNTQTGQTYLCGPAARRGMAVLACIRARLPGVEGQQ